MTTGEQLVNLLNLSKLKNIYARRSIGLAVPILHIVFDSFRVNLPFSKTYILQKFNTDFYWSNHLMVWTPFFQLRYYNGHTKNIMVLINDLAGSYLKNDNLYKESISLIDKPDKVYNLQEFVTMADLMDKENISSIIKRTRKERNKVLGTENILAKLSDCEINDKEDWIEFKFLTSVTEPIYPKEYKYKYSDPNDNFKLKNDPSKTYEVDLRFLDFFKWMKGIYELNEITEKEIKEIFSVLNVKVWSESPFFHWGGCNYNDSQLDASIYPTDIEPQVWNVRQGGEYFLDKHIYGLIRQFKFFMSPMASMLNRKLKDRGFLK